MKIIFFGTPLFAAKILQHIINQKHSIAAIVCPPDKKAIPGTDSGTLFSRH